MPPPGARVVTCVGGMDPMKERRQLAGGAHIVVGTPGRLRDHLSAVHSTCPSSRSRCSTKPTRCSTWASARNSRKSSTRRRPSAARCCSRQPCRGRSSRSRSATRRTRFRIETLGDNQGHGDIAYQAVGGFAGPTSNTPWSTCCGSTRPRPRSCSAPHATPCRRLHASLTERGFHAVALSGEHSQSERNNALQALRDQRARVASRPMWQRAESTCRRSRW